MPAQTRGRRTRPNTISPEVGAPASAPRARAAAWHTSASVHGWGPTGSASTSPTASAASSRRNAERRIGSPPASARLGAGEDAVELLVGDVSLIEQLDEVARGGADIIGKLVRIQQPGDPAQPDDAIERGRRIDAAGWQPRRGQNA